MGIKITVLSDLHAGHTAIPVTQLTRHLEEYFMPKALSSDIVIINGDFFDTLLDLSDPRAYIIMQFINKLLDLTNQHDILVRVVRGTFSHDRNQLQFFESEEWSHVKYFKTLAIEYIEGLGIHIMYIPDDLHVMNIRDAVEDVLSANGLDKVDLICNHGYLTHLVPENIPSITNKAIDSDWISSKTQLLVNGHIHQLSIYKNLISCGSFEAMTHADTGPVGFIYIEYNKDNNSFEWEHVENLKSRKFVTFTSKEVGDTCINSFIKWLKTISLGTILGLNIAIKVSDTLVRPILQNYARDMFPKASVKYLPHENKQDASTNICSTNKYVQNNALTEDNYLSILHDEIKLDRDVDIPIDTLKLYVR